MRFESIYPGINLVYRGTQGRLEYDFVIAPNGDPSRIKMNIEGADALSLDGAGNLAIKTAGGEVIQKAPAIYQESQGTRHPIAGGYALMGKHSVAFKLAAYDRNAPLIIDPLLTYVSYLDGSDDAFGYGIGVDSEGGGGRKRCGHGPSRRSVLRRSGSAARLPQGEVLVSESGSRPRR